MQLICKHQNLPVENITQIYQTMAFSATLDIHAEVRYRGLKFWQEVIGELLRNQGMIDGSFPNVTFSKENRKIVTLTEIEIKTRLRKVLRHLSEIGCLGVLLSAIQDDTDFEVAKEGVAITKTIFELLNRYGANLSDDCGTASSTNHCEAMPKSKTKRSFSNASFNSHSTGSSSIKIVTPCYFLDFIRLQNLDKLIEKRALWLRSFDNYLHFVEEMLNDCEEADRMDCY